MGQLAEGGNERVETAPNATERVWTLLKQAYGHRPGASEDAFIRDGMSVMELVRLYELVRTSGCHSALEVGMAMGTSSVVICAAILDNGGGQLTSVDPFQVSPEGYASAGIASVRKAKLDHLHRLEERPDFIALPDLLGQGLRYGFIFIDGWHSFDYTLVDLFYADLLLKKHGTLALHDATAPPVYKAVSFLEQNKPYKRISPLIVQPTRSLVRKVARRVSAFLRPAVASAARERREKWRMLAAYQKEADLQVPEHHSVQF
jgi:predicted O-methyltransferase YrrM